jgi:hypothetical protein
VAVWISALTVIRRTAISNHRRHWQQFEPAQRLQEQFRRDARRLVARRPCWPEAAGLPKSTVGAAEFERNSYLEPRAGRAAMTLAEGHYSALIVLADAPTLRT